MTFASDLYDLGAVFYRILTGRDVAFEGELPQSPAETNGQIPVDLERIVLKLLHPEPAKRGPGAVLEVLEQRLRDRGTENEETIARRLEVARQEWPHACTYTHEIINQEELYRAYVTTDECNMQHLRGHPYIMSRSGSEG